MPAGRKRFASYGTATEEIVDGAMNGKKPLGLPWGFEPAHQVFPLARWLMRDFCPVVSTAILAVVHAGQELSASSAITTQAISYKQPGSIGKPF